MFREIDEFVKDHDPLAKELLELGTSQLEFDDHPLEAQNNT